MNRPSPRAAISALIALLKIVSHRGEIGRDVLAGDPNRHGIEAALTMPWMKAVT